MCVDDDSFPPIPPISGGAAGSSDLHLTSSDGTGFMAHAARAAKSTGAGMVVIPDVTGWETNPLTVRPEISVGAPAYWIPNGATKALKFEISNPAPSSPRNSAPPETM